MSITSDFWKAMNQSVSKPSNSDSAKSSGSSQKFSGGSEIAPTAKKKKKNISDEFWDAMGDDDIAPVSNVASRMQARANGSLAFDTYRQGITRFTGGTKAKDEEDKRKWYEKGLFEDGYDFGDVTKTILGINDDSASLKDLTVNSLKRGYYNSIYGEESFKAMNGGQNKKDLYADILAGDDYQFTPGNDFAGAVSGAMELLGQQARQWTNPRTLGVVGAAVGATAIAGNAGPQALVPEEVLTIPAAATAAFKAGSAASNLEIEAGHAYNEMLDAGISEDTAKKVAWTVGLGNAGLDLLQLDELMDAYKVTKASGATKTFTKKILDELVDRGVDVAKETAQEVAQEGVTIAGTQLASKLDNGEYAYTSDEVKDRLNDTAKSSALSFGLMNVPAAAKNTFSIINDQKKTNVPADSDFDAPIVTKNAETEQKQTTAQPAKTEPRILYTGSPNTDIKQFKVGGANGSKQTGDRYGKGVYLTTNESTAKNYAGDSGRVYKINADGLNIFNLNDTITPEMQESLIREFNGSDKQFRNSMLRNFRTEMTFDDFESAEAFFDHQRKVWKEQDGEYAANKPEILEADNETGRAVIEFTDFENWESNIGTLTGNHLYDALKSLSTDDFSYFITGHGFDGIAFDEDSDNQQYVIYRNEDRLHIDDGAEEQTAADQNSTSENANWRELAHSLPEPEFEGEEWTREYINRNNSVRSTVLSSATSEVIRDVESGLTTEELTQKAQDALNEYEQLQSQKDSVTSFTEAEQLVLTALYNQYSMYNSVAKDPSYVNELKKAFDFAPVAENATSTTEDFSAPEVAAAEETGTVNPELQSLYDERQALQDTIMSRYQEQLYDDETENLAKQWSVVNNRIAEMEASHSQAEKSNQANSQPERESTPAEKAQAHYRGDILSKLVNTGSTTLKAVDDATKQAQKFIAEGADGIKSIPGIFGKISTDGNLGDFELYLRHMLNVDRTTLKDRVGVDGVPVWGFTAEESQQEADRLLKEHPEFKQAAEDVYAFNDYVMNLLVKSGKNTQEQAVAWKEYYPHYIPISRPQGGDVQPYSELLKFIQGESSEDSFIKSLDDFAKEADLAADLHKATYTGEGFNPLIDTMVNRAFLAHWANAISQGSDNIAPVGSDGIQSAPMSTDTAHENHTETEPDKVTVTTEPVVDSTRPSDFDSNKLLDNRMTLGKVIQEYILDNGFVFEKKSKASGNRQLEAKWHANRNALASAQHFIGHGKGDVRAVTDILKEVKKSGLQTEFYSYLGHLRNMDGMSLQSRYGVANNHNFMGRDNTFAKSTKAIKKLEDAHPEFKKMAEDVYKNADYVLNQFVEHHMITQDDKDLIKELYPHYVPMRYSSSGSLDGMLETLAQFTNESFGTWAMNDFGLELMNTLHTEIHSEPMNIDAFINRLDSGDSLFSFGNDGEYKTFTVYENGELKTFDIDREMYMALNDSDNWMNMKIPVLHQINEGFRKFCTEWNIFFATKNGVKDPQDIMYNSRHPVETYGQLIHAGDAILNKDSKYRHYYDEYLENGGEPITFYDTKDQSFVNWTDPSELVQYATGLKAVSAINDRIEKLPRLAEYIAGREMGLSVQEAMLDSARVTTNFAAGGKFTKFLNRNGCTFLNASVQSALQHARNFAEAASDSDGKLHFDTKDAKMAAVKGTTAMIARGLAVGMTAIAINDLRWKDDEEYEELPDYVKEGYYLLFKFGDGQFFRLPKGRTNATIEAGLRTVAEQSFGDDDADWNHFWKTFIENIAPNNPATDNIFAPIREVAKGETWYGEDMIPYRLKDLPTTEQFDEKTDSISIGLSEKLDDTLNQITLDDWLNEKLDDTKIGEWLSNSGFGDGLSPKEINYLINSYTGVLGDLVLPYHTPKAESPYDNPIAQSLAPLKDIFTTDSVLNNRITGDFFDKMEEIDARANSDKATEKDKMLNQFFISNNAEMSDLWQEIRDIQTSDMPDSEKYKRNRELREQINEMMEHAMDVYNDGKIKVDVKGVYSEVGDRRYNYDDDDDAWYEIKPRLADGSENYYYKKEQEVTKALGISYEEYWNNRTEYNFQYKFPELHTLSEAVGGFDYYNSFVYDMWDVDSDYDDNGESISGTYKKNLKAFVDELDLTDVQKDILMRSQYKYHKFDHHRVIDYLNERDDISFNEMKSICETLGMTVDDEGNISW